MPQLPVGLMRDLGWGSVAALLLLMCFYILLGCFMDSLSMILLTVPFVFTIVAALEIDPIWFGILLVTVVEIGLITPPIGMNLFVLRVAADIPLQTILADIVRLTILIAFPAISLWLPSRMD